MTDFQVTSVKLTPVEAWQLKAIQAKTKQTASEILRAGLRDQVERYEIGTMAVILPIPRKRRKHDNSEY